MLARAVSLPWQPIWAGEKTARASSAATLRMDIGKQEKEGGFFSSFKGYQLFAFAPIEGVFSLL
jgi:hypothetical protein